MDILYPYAPHYRLGVFRKLMIDPRVEYRIFAGTSALTETILLIDPADFPFSALARNYWWRSILVQPYTVWHAMTTNAEAVIHVGDARFAMTWLAAPILRLRGKRVFYWTIGWHRPETGWKRVGRILFYRLANKLLLYGETAREIGKSQGYPADRMAVIGNSHDVNLDSENSSDDDPPWFPPARSEIIGAVVRPNKNKRLDLLIAAAATLGSRGRPVHVCIIGEGPQRDQLQAYARSLNVAATLPGACHDPAVLKRFYERLAVTVVPEAAGLTVIQSLWHGRPVVTSADAYSQMPEFEAVKPGVTGSLYLPGDVEQLCAAIEYWLDQVKKHSSAVENNCRAEAAEWSAARHAERITQAVLES